MFRRKADKPDRLKEIDTNIQRLEDSLASASKDRKNQITQEIAKWNKLRDTLQKTFENKATCDKYLIKYRNPDKRSVEWCAQFVTDVPNKRTFRCG